MFVLTSTAVIAVDYGPINSLAVGGCFRCVYTACYSKLNGYLNCDGLGNCDGDCATAIGHSAPFSVQTDVELRGRIVDQGGNPVTSQSVLIHLPTGQQLQVITGLEGAWSLRIETSSENLEIIDIGDIGFWPDGTPGSDGIQVIVVKCPAEGVCS